MPKFEKGKSGNPKGRPKKEYTLSNLLREKLDEVVEVEDKKTKKKKKVTNAQLLVDRVMRGVRLGEKWAIEMMFDRIEGKPNQKVEQSGSLSVFSAPQIVFDEPKTNKTKS